MINIKEVIWTNFLGYGDYKNSVTFDDIGGVCLIEGEIEGNSEREEGDEKLNAAGKTSAIEAIVWGLFGSTTRVENPGDIVINWDTGKNCRVSVKTKDGYEIVRMRKYSGSSIGSGLTEVVLFKDGEDITKSTSLPVQQYINEIFGIEYHTFIRSVVFGQFSGGFLELSDQKIRKVMESIMNIGDLSPIVKTAKAKIAGLDKEIIAINADISNHDNNIDRINNQINNLKDKSSSFKEEIKKEIKLVKSSLIGEKDKNDNKIKKVESEIKTKDEERGSIKPIDINLLNNEWSSYKEDIDKYEHFKSELEFVITGISDKTHQIELNNNTISSIPDDDKIDIDDLKKEHEAKKELKDNIEKREQARDQLNEIIANLTAKIDHDDEFLNKDHDYSVCPECRTEVDSSSLKNAKKEAENRIKKLKEKLDEVKGKKSKLEKSISKLLEDYNSTVLDSVENVIKHNSIVDKNVNKKSDLDLSNKTLSTEISDLLSKKEELQKISEPDRPSISVSEAKTNNDYIASIDDVINKLQSRIKELKLEFNDFMSKTKDEIDNIRNKNDPYIGLIKEELDLLNDIREDKLKDSKLVDEKKTIKLHLDYIRESYNNKRKIKAFWISELIPEFNRYLKYYLDFFEVEDKLEFDELLSPKLDKWGYNTHSGGECKRIDISIMLALGDLHSTIFGPQANFMVFDEIDGRVDPFTINKIVSLLSDDIINRDGMTNIFVISHRKEMKDRFPNKIKVKNKQGRSYIVNHG